MGKREGMSRSDRISAYARESEHRIAQLPGSSHKDGTFHARANAIDRQVAHKYGLSAPSGGCMITLIVLLGVAASVLTIIGALTQGWA